MNTTTINERKVVNKILKQAIKRPSPKNCSICLDKIRYGLQSLVKLNCRHVQHLNCIKEWVDVHNKNTCPECRDSIYEDPISDNNTDSEYDSDSEDDNHEYIEEIENHKKIIIIFIEQMQRLRQHIKINTERREKIIRTGNIEPLFNISVTSLNKTIQHYEKLVLDDIQRIIDLEKQIIFYKNKILEIHNYMRQNRMQQQMRQLIRQRVHQYRADKIERHQKRLEEKRLQKISRKQYRDYIKRDHNKYIYNNNALSIFRLKYRK